MRAAGRLAAWLFLALGPIAVTEAGAQGVPRRRLAIGSSSPRWVTGNPGDVVTPVRGGLVLAGGGADQDEAMRVLVAASGGGDVVVLRASGTPAYNPYLFGLGTVDSVETLFVDDAARAAEPFVVDTVLRAEALFVAGGDQADYVRCWRGAPLGRAMQAAIDRGVPIGGTSAGLAILGEFVYAALAGSVVSAEALADPYDSRLTLVRDFLRVPLLAGVITDSHFVTRDRMGRLVAFLARLARDGWAAQPRGLGVDEGAAVIVDAAGRATVTAGGRAYFLRLTMPPNVCEPGSPLAVAGVEVVRLERGGSFDLGSWSGSGTVTYRLDAAGGTLRSSQVGGALY